MLLKPHSHSCSLHAGPVPHRPQTSRANARQRPALTVCRAAEGNSKNKVVVVGAGWAGLGAAWHLVSQGYEVDVLEASPHPGGLVSGWKTAQGRSVEVGIHGYWGSYANIFELTRQLGIYPFTDWTPSNQYSPEGLEVVAPIFRDMPQLPTPAGHFLYSDFKRLPLPDRLSALPLLIPASDFDHTAEAWQRYDGMSARELFRRTGITARLYQDAFQPMLLVGLFAPGEICSAAATLGMLRFFLLSHQEDFDVVWCRGTTGDMIFRPWIQRMEALGARFHFGTAVRDFQLDPVSGRVTRVTAASKGGPPQEFEVDSAILAVGINGMKKIVAGSKALQQPDFRRVNNLGSVDVLAVRLWLDRRVHLPKASNAVANFDAGMGWTFFDLTQLHDEYRDSPVSVIEADFYHSSPLMAMSDEEIVAKVMRDIAVCEPVILSAAVTDHVVVKAPSAVTHFSPGCYPNLLRRQTSVPGLFAAGDWIANEHGSFSQEKAYVTGLEAANEVIARCGQGEPADIEPLAVDEPHVAGLAAVQKLGRQLQSSLSPLSMLLSNALPSL